VLASPLAVTGLPAVGLGAGVAVALGDVVGRVLAVGTVEGVAFALVVGAADGVVAFAATAGVDVAPAPVVAAFVEPERLTATK
jgi:hypothetical protein